LVWRSQTHQEDDAMAEIHRRDERWERDREQDWYEGPDRAPRRNDGSYAYDRGYGAGPGVTPAPGRPVARSRDPAQRPSYDERSYLRAQNDFGGPYADYGRAHGGYGAGGGYTPNPEEGLGREQRSWGDRASDEVRTWFGDRAAEQRRDWDAMGQHRGRGPKGYTRSDERIREDVCDRLTDDAVVDASEIEVLVSAAEVTLNGSVGSRAEKRRAEDCVESVMGVGHVQNNLRVSHAIKPGSIAAQTDPHIAAIAEGRDAGDVAHDYADERLGPMDRGRGRN
jgi:osmotically-inducible protein OsmY